MVHDYDPLPEYLMRSKSPEMRKRLLKRKYESHKKSSLIYFAWLAVLGIFGAHRIYLEQYKAAVFVFLIGGLSFSYSQMREVDSSGTDFDLLSFFPLFVILVELILLPLSVAIANRHIRSAIFDESDSVPFVLSVEGK